MWNTKRTSEAQRRKKMEKERERERQTDSNNTAKNENGPWSIRLYIYNMLFFSPSFAFCVFRMHCCCAVGHQVASIMGPNWELVLQMNCNECIFVCVIPTAYNVVSSVCIFFFKYIFYFMFVLQIKFWSNARWQFFCCPEYHRFGLAMCVCVWYDTFFWEKCISRFAKYSAFLCWDNKKRLPASQTQYMQYRLRMY